MNVIPLICGDSRSKPIKQMFMRKITLIIVHCSANKEGSTLRMADIDRYHRSLGWKGCGYHYVIPTDGTIEVGRPEEVKGAHCKNHNNHSIGVCYVGGLAADGKTPKDTRTEEQKRALRMLLENLHKRYPKALIVGHCDLDPKKPCCPGFNVINENGNENVYKDGVLCPQADGVYHRNLNGI